MEVPDPVAHVAGVDGRRGVVVSAPEMRRMPPTAREFPVHANV